MNSVLFNDNFKNVIDRQTPEKKANEQRSRKRKGDTYDSNSQGETKVLYTVPMLRSLLCLSPARRCFPR